MLVQLPCKCEACLPGMLEIKCWKVNVKEINVRSTCSCIFWLIFFATRTTKWLTKERYQLRTDVEKLWAPIKRQLMNEESNLSITSLHGTKSVNTFKNSYAGISTVMMRCPYSFKDRTGTGWLMSSINNWPIVLFCCCCFLFLFYVCYMNFQ